MYDAVVIGGGFYGTAIAAYLATHRGCKRVALLERGDVLLSRASYNNQARVHNGYHYPRSYTTAFRSRINFPNFTADYGAAVSRNFFKLYAIARRNSHVTARTFGRFCQEIGAALEPAPAHLKKLFEPRLIEEVYLVEECAFDAARLAQAASESLSRAGVEIHTGTEVRDVTRDADDIVLEGTKHGERESFHARYVFNCTYSGLNRLRGDFPGTRMPLKHEITELALVQPPPELEDVGVTVMDGPFFSLMPFPARGAHSLSHVRYTPHLSWADAPDIDPYARLAAYPRESRVERMIRDAARYLPAARRARYIESLFEVKTVLTKNESDDGRPILFERHEALPGCYSILGGKIDNIYDVLEKLDREPLPLRAPARSA
jgi:glycine/D-amino acid oxidase-like deaminating enzyme